MTAQKISILGAEYTIKCQSIKDNEMFKDCDGYIDWTKHEIYIRDYSIDKDEFEYKDWKTHMNKTLRHEIIHGFLHESGLWINSGTITHNWAMNEEMVDWFAIQSPKIFKVYQELGIL